MSARTNPPRVAQKRKMDEAPFENMETGHFYLDKNNPKAYDVRFLKIS